MKYTTIPTTDIRIPRLCVGAMSFGRDDNLPVNPHATQPNWTLDQDETTAMVKHCLDLGLTFFDTANVYSEGRSERYLGHAFAKLGVARQDVQIASKVYFNPGKLSKDAILREIDGTLERLGTDYLDLYIIHRFDYDTPIEETMETLSSLVDEGKVRALGASAMMGYQFHDMQNIAEKHGWHQFVAMENHYNLIYREDEREMIPLCREQGVMLMPYSPLAGGRLARPNWNGTSKRAQLDAFARTKYDHAEQQDIAITARVYALAEKHGVSMSEISLAWLLAKGVESPIVGATKEKHISDAVAALDVELSDEEIAFLEEPYTPHTLVGPILQ